MKTKDIRELSEAEIAKLIRDHRESLLNLRMRKQTGQIEQPHEFTRLRREVARLETIRRQKQTVPAQA